MSPIFCTEGPLKGADLMSLAEKGRAGRANSSASSSCSTTSGEDESHATGVRHRDHTHTTVRRYAQQNSVDEEEAPLVSTANSQDVSCTSSPYKTVVCYNI